MHRPRAPGRLYTCCVCVCVCFCVHECVCARAHACVCVCVCVSKSRRSYTSTYMCIYTSIQEISWLFSHSKRQAPPAFLTLRWGDVLPNKHKVSQQILKSPLYRDLYSKYTRPLTSERKKKHKVSPCTTIGGTARPNTAGRVFTPRESMRRSRHLRPVK